MSRTKIEFRGTFEARQVGLPSAVHACRPTTTGCARPMVLLAMFLALPAGVTSQQRTPPVAFGPKSSSTSTIDPTLPMMDGTGVPDARLVAMLNAARQRSLVSNTDKLVKLARELDDEVAATKATNMTESELRKVARIEKLARSVKEEMRYSVIGGPTAQETRTVAP